MLMCDRQRYVTFQQQITLTAGVVTAATVHPPAVQVAIANLQKQFQSEILPLENYSPQIVPEQMQRLRSLQVEMDKQLKLLAMDALFLQAARQATTVAQRQQQMSDRLTYLQRYCEGVLDLIAT